MLTLLLQLNGDLPKEFPGHERRLYVLSCPRKQCRRKDGSVRAIRGVRISPEASALAAEKEANKDKKLEPKPALIGQGKTVTNTMFGDSLFGGSKPTGAAGGGMFGGNPFSSGSASSSPFAQSADLAAKPAQKPVDKAAEELPKTFAKALNIEDKPAASPAPPSEPWPQDSELPKPYPLFYLADADYEILDKDEEVPTQKIEMMEMDTEVEASGSGGGKEDKDVYESSIDNTFQKFADRLSQNPEQVIRYEFAGQPLLYTKNDAVGKALGAKEGNEKVRGQKSGSGIPKCSNCGKGRVFEVQLTPHAITELESEEMTLEGMEWGTIIVGVCEADCQAKGVEAGRVGYVEEWAGVQWEEVIEPSRR